MLSNGTISRCISLLKRGAAELALIGLPG